MKQLKLKTSWNTAIEELSDAECGRLFRGMLIYASSGEAPKLGGSERILWAKARAEIDEQRSVSEKRAEAGRIGGSKPKQIEANGSKEKTPPLKPPVKENQKKGVSKDTPKEKALSPALDDAVRAFRETRSKMHKPMTELAVKLLLNRLEQLAPGNEQRQVAMLMQSIENGWTGVYELKQELKRRDRNTLKNYDEAPQAVTAVELDVEEL